MLDERNRRTAEKHGILDLATTLQTKLMALDGVEDVVFDLDGFWDDIPYIIIVLQYSISGENYFQKRRALLKSIINTAAELGLVRTDDRIEDYGQHFYIVTRLSRGATT